MITRRYRAKTLDTGRVVEGFYVEYPETTYCLTSDYEAHPVKTIHSLIVPEMTDWGLPNRLVEYRINPDTLEEVSDVLAEKTWTRQDIRDSLIARGFAGTDENIQKVIETGYLNDLEEVLVAEWDVIDAAIYARDDLEEK